MWESDLSPYGVELIFEDDRARILLRGEVGIATGVALVDAATSSIARFRVLEIDLRAVTAMDEVGARALIKVQRFADAHDSMVEIAGASGGVAEMLLATGVHQDLSGSFSKFLGLDV
jgi:ABC-type transporter Mla MlaB component